MQSNEDEKSSEMEETSETESREGLFREISSNLKSQQLRKHCHAEGIWLDSLIALVPLTHSCSAGLLNAVLEGQGGSQCPRHRPSPLHFQAHNCPLNSYGTVVQLDYRMMQLIFLGIRNNIKNNCTILCTGFWSIAFMFIIAFYFHSIL